MRLLGAALASLLGVAAGISAVAVHRSPAGIVLGVGTALVVIRTLRSWLPVAAAAFAGGWLVPVVLAVAGRAEGDVAVASDPYGWLLIASGFVILVTGILWGRGPAVQRDSNPHELRT
jgi:hypothetical protein